MWWFIAARSSRLCLVSLGESTYRQKWYTFLGIKILVEQIRNGKETIVATIVNWFKSISHPTEPIYMRWRTRFIRPRKIESVEWETCILHAIFAFVRSSLDLDFISRIMGLLPIHLKILFAIQACSAAFVDAGVHCMEHFFLFSMHPINCAFSFSTVRPGKKPTGEMDNRNVADTIWSQ